MEIPTNHSELLKLSVYVGQYDDYIYFFNPHIKLLFKYYYKTDIIENITSHFHKINKVIHYNNNIWILTDNFILCYNNEFDKLITKINLQITGSRTMIINNNIICYF